MNRALLFCMFLLPFYANAAIEPDRSMACETAIEAKSEADREAILNQCMARGESESECNKFVRQTYRNALRGDTDALNNPKYATLPECNTAK